MVTRKNRELGAFCAHSIGKAGGNGRILLSMRMVGR
jgi:hypothetical protein